jgi:hypothetical protein
MKDSEQNGRKGFLNGFLRANTYSTSGSLTPIICFLLLGCEIRFHSIIRTAYKIAALCILMCRFLERRREDNSESYDTNQSLIYSALGECSCVTSTL